MTQELKPWGSDLDFIPKATGSHWRVQQGYFILSLPRDLMSLHDPTTPTQQSHLGPLPNSCGWVLSQVNITKLSVISC